MNPIENISTNFFTGMSDLSSNVPLLSLPALNFNLFACLSGNCNNFNAFNTWSIMPPMVFNATSTTVGDSFVSSKFESSVVSENKTTKKTDVASKPISANVYTEQGVSVLEKRWSRVASSKYGFNHQFYKEVVDFAKQLKVDPDDIMTIFYSESGLNCAIQRKSDQGIFGCIGSTRSLYKVDGVNGHPLLKNMSPVEQFRVYKKMTLDSYKAIYGNNPPDRLSTGVFYAINGNAPKLRRLVQKYGPNGITDNLPIIDGTAYSANRAIDYEKKGFVSIGNLASRLQKKKAEALKL